MNPPPDSDGQPATESRDTVLIEINDTDHPWRKVSPEEAERLIAEIRRRLPPPPPKPPTS